MLTREQVLKAVKGGRVSRCIDGRDYVRLVEFVPMANWEDLGFLPKVGVTEHSPREWTHENIVAQLTEDVAFGFEKALGQRGISSFLMFECVRLWLWILEDELQSFDQYAQYGLPLFKAVATKYGLPNPIGDDTGDELKYSEVE